MRKIVDYKVVTDMFECPFSELIQEHIEKGWQPLGGVQIDNPCNGIGRFYQTMVKYEEEVVVIRKDFKLPTKRAIKPPIKLPIKPYIP